MGSFAAELEGMLDGVCTEVCREITSLIEREKALGEILTSQNETKLEVLEDLRRESHASILHAYTTLYRTYAELVDLEQLPLEFSPVAREKESSSRLRGLVHDLKEEAALISRANRRVKASYESVPAETTYAGDVSLES